MLYTIINHKPSLPTFYKVGELPPDQDETITGLNPSKEFISLIIFV